MPRTPPPRRPRRLTTTGGPAPLRFRLLWHDVTIDVPDPAVADALAFMVNDAEQRVTAEHEVELLVQPHAPGYVVREGSELLGTCGDARSVLDVVYQVLYQRCFDRASRDGWVRVHGALVDVGGRRVLLGGPAGTGKTTLALRLLLGGAAVHGDESVLVRDGVALAVPRPLHLKSGIERFVPEVAEHLGTLPVIEAPDGHPVWAFDPTLLGAEWVIEPGSVDAVVALHRGQDARLERVPSVDVMHDFVSEVFLLHESKSDVVRQIAGLVGRVPTYRLTLGDPTAAAMLLR